jgi:two-component system, sensor histidine kinase and response regulator
MSTENRSNALIQVVEDDPHLRMAISETLRSFDFEVETFANGALALAWLEHHRPDLILCDIMMPEMDGYTFLRHTRADPQLRTLPFIFLTARTSQADQRLAREIGIEDYLTKPIDSESLVVAIKNALRRQQAMREEMQQEMEALRNRIVSVLQHEFRTPLTFVLGYAEYLLEAIEGSFDPEELRSSLAAILDGGQRLQRLIESFLLLAELQAYNLKVEDLSDVSAASLWAMAMQGVDLAIRQANLQTVVDDRNSHLLVNINAQLVGESLRRLLDNAVRYSRPEAKTLTLSVEWLAPYVGFRIEDEGIGMTPEQVQTLARPFEQPDRENRTTPGAGLSLALVRHVAKLHGGSLEIKSIPGKGSVFTLWLPISPTASATENQKVVPAL